MQRLFFAMETSAADIGFEQWQFRIDGSIDPRVLRRAIERTIDATRMLRTAFVDDGGAAAAAGRARAARRCRGRKTTGARCRRVHKPQRSRAAARRRRRRLRSRHAAR